MGSSGVGWIFTIGIGKGGISCIWKNLGGFQF